MDTTKSIGTVIPKVLAEISAPATKAKPPSMTFEQFKQIANFQTLGDPELTVILEETAKFACEVNNGKPRWLTLVGESGTGKTHLAKAVMRSFNKITKHDLYYDKDKNFIGGNRGQFVSWRELCAVARGGEWGWIEDLCEDDLVILDDIGSEYDKNGFISSMLDRLLNARMRKWTMLTCNLALDQIADRMDVRIASRMIRPPNKVAETKAKDFALRNI